MSITTKQERLEQMHDALEKISDGFQWGQGDNALGEVRLDREANMLRLDVYVIDTDEPDDDIDRKGLTFSREVDPYLDPYQQIRELIHWHLAHEADEQMWFTYENDSLPGGIYMDRPFYPHNEDGSLRDV